MLERFEELLEEYAAEIRGDCENEYEDKLLDAYQEIDRLKKLETLLHDLGIDPDGFYSMADREILRARIVGASVLGVSSL